MIALIYILFILSLFIMFPVLHILGLILIDIFVIRLNLKRQIIDSNKE
jgi:hypothetical protein